MTKLDQNKQLVSDVWVDQPDAHEQVDERRRDGRATDDEAAALHHFVDNGYLVTSLDLDEDFARRFDEEIERVWRERPPDLAAAAKQDPLTSFRDVEASARDVGYRIADLHAHSPLARALYLHPSVFRLVRLIFDEEPVAFQSLFFEWGSEQGLHRDPMFVPTDPPSHLTAAWIALEDITEDAGPLLYVPGSHRMPWFEFEADTVRFVTKDPETRARWIAHRDRMIEEMGLEVQSLTCRRGDAFLWHTGLLHGGGRVGEARPTRKSFVTHYSTRAAYTVRKGQMRARIEGEERGVGRQTNALVVEGDRVGFDGPLRGILDDGAPGARSAAHAG